MLDPFAGSGTTLVQALESGHDAVGVDVAAFNCLLMRVKTTRYDLFRLERELRDALARLGQSRAARAGTSASGMRRAPRPSSSTSARVVEEYEHADVLRVVLARAARSARLTTHFDLDFPRVPQREPYWCHKHRRDVPPVQEADKFLSRYLLDTLDRIKAFQQACEPAAERARSSTETRGRWLSTAGSTAIVTSPPYPGLIDYHEQHRYAYELLDLDDRRDRELGAAPHAERAGGASTSTSCGIAAVLRRCAEALAPAAPVLVVVNDRRDLYPDDPRASGLQLVDRLERHVNRRTGRRAGEYFESVLVAVRET